LVGSKVDWSKIENSIAVSIPPGVLSPWSLRARIATFGQNKPEINDWSKAMRGKPKKTFF
jgi:hypothetical protein